MNASDTPIRVLSVDDHPLMREGIAEVLRTQSDIHLVAEAANGADAIRCFQQHRPHVVLMDLQMPVMNGIEATRAICRDTPDARIVVLTTYKGDAQAISALKAGAYGYLLKTTLVTELIDTIRIVHSGRRRIPTEVAMDIAEHTAEDALSLREIEVLRHVAVGCANKDIAALIGVSEGTVKVHMKNIMAKLAAKDRTHAVTIALKRGIIEL